MHGMQDSILTSVLHSMVCTVADYWQHDPGLCLFINASHQLFHVRSNLMYHKFILNVVKATLFLSYNFVQRLKLSYQQLQLALCSSGDSALCAVCAMAARPASFLVRVQACHTCHLLGSGIRCVVCVFLTVSAFLQS